jgi:hypothetical protein
MYDISDMNCALNNYCVLPIYQIRWQGCGTTQSGVLLNAILSWSWIMRAQSTCSDERERAAHALGQTVHFEF